MFWTGRFCMTCRRLPTLALTHETENQSKNFVNIYNSKQYLFHYKFSKVTYTFNTVLNKSLSGSTQATKTQKCTTYKVQESTGQQA